VAQDLARVTQRIKVVLDEMGSTAIVTGGNQQLLQAPVFHLFLGEGKLLRPILMLLASRASGGADSAEEPLIHAAAAAEILHTASLAHDDIVDGSESRRGSRSLHAAYGSSVAVLVGDLFYARFFQEISGLRGTDAEVRRELMDTFLAVTARMCQGEILEDAIRSDGRSASLEEYLGICEAKTAGLVSACCRAGALLCGAPRHAVSSMADYGQALGLLFQIADDVSDGDAAFPFQAVMRGKAREYADTAAAALAKLEKFPAAVMLRELCGHLLARAEKASSLPT
jgi:heptaprenyl diphosphate synthase